jgi:hypothetical protein
LNRDGFQVTANSLQQGDLDGLADVIHPETPGRRQARAGESARCEAEPQRIRKAIEEDMMPDTTDRRVRRRQGAGRQRVGKAAHKSGKRAGRGVLRGGQNALDPALPQGIERAGTTQFAMVLLQETK